MHVLLIPSFYPSPIRPTTGIFFIDQLNALRQVGHTVGVLIAPRLYETMSVLRHTKRLPPSVEDTADPRVYRLHSLWVPRVFPHISSMFYRRAGLHGFQHYVESHGMPDVIHAHNVFYGGDIAVAIQQQYGVPIVLTEHSTNYLRGRIFLPAQHQIARRTLNHVNQALAVGQVLVDALTKKYQPARPIHTIANVVDTAYFEPSPHKEKFIISAVGQLKKRKRFDFLIRAFTQVFRDADVYLEIGGAGPEMGALQVLIDNLDMSAQIKLLGHLSREAVRNLFQRSSVVISSSQIETFGVTLIEAMSCGVPVIATRSGGPEQFVTDDVGLLIPVDDAEALQHALVTLHENIKDYDAQQIRAYCIERFSLHAIGSRLTDIYQQVT